MFSRWLRNEPEDLLKVDPELFAHRFFGQKGFQSIPGGWIDLLPFAFAGPLV
jgi:hypothetical protein